MAQLILPLVARRPRRLQILTDEPPVGPPRAGQTDRAEPQARPRQDGNADHRFILLIVDDDPLMTEMLPRRLRRVVHADVDIRTATTPEEASAMIRTLHPDAVLSDYNLRQIRTGLDVLRDVAEAAPHAARILFSGHSRGEIIGLNGADVHAYVEKPMRLDELIPPVLDAIERATGRDLRGGARGG